MNTSVLEENQGEILGEKRSPVGETKEVFKEKAFCIVGEEMKAKMGALGLNEDDIVDLMNHVKGICNNNNIEINTNLFLDFVLLCNNNRLIINRLCLVFKKIFPQITFDNLLIISIMAIRESEDYLKQIFDTLFHSKEENRKFFIENYELFIKLGVIAGENSYDFFSVTDVQKEVIKFISRNNSFIHLLIPSFQKIGPDFIYVLYHNSKDIERVLNSMPERFIEFCEYLGKIICFLEHDQESYIDSLQFITSYLVDNPDKWNYLLKIGELFGKRIFCFLTKGSEFTINLAKFFPSDYEDILDELIELSLYNFGEKNTPIILMGVLSFLNQYISGGKERLIQIISELYILIEEYNSEILRDYFHDAREFVITYIKYFPSSWFEVSKRICKVVKKNYYNENENGDGFFKQFRSGFDNFISSKIIDQDPRLLNELLNFLERVGGSKDALRLISSFQHDGI